MPCVHWDITPGPFEPLKFADCFLDDGRFFSAAAMRFGGNDKRIMNTEFHNFLPYRMLFTKQNNPYWLDGEYFELNYLIVYCHGMLILSSYADIQKLYLK